MLPDKADKINHLIRNKIVCIQYILKQLEKELAETREQLNLLNLDEEEIDD